jgi:hypothetical protein
LVWAPLAVALTTTGGAVLVYGLDRWAELSTYRRTRVRDVAPRIVAVAIISSSGVVMTQLLLAGPTPGTFRYFALISSFLGAVPAFGVMEAVRHAADSDATSTLSTNNGAQVGLLLSLRPLLQRLLAAVGALVALSTLATGTVLALQRELGAAPGTVKLPTEIVVIFGGAGSLLVALFYVPAAGALRRWGQRLCGELFPLDEVTEPSAILRLAEDRHKLEQLLGVDRGVVADLQTGLAILGPLFASAASAFLSP